MLYTYIYIYICIYIEREREIMYYVMDFRGFDSSIISIVKGWNSQAHMEIPGEFESSSLSREHISREIWRTIHWGTTVCVKLHSSSAPSPPHSQQIPAAPQTSCPDALPRCLAEMFCMCAKTCCCKQPLSEHA